MKKLTLYIIYLLMLAFTVSCNRSSKIPDLKETYAYQDTRPFGAMATYSFVRQSYKYPRLSVSKENFATNFALNSDTSTIQFSISKALVLQQGDLDALLSFIYKGNTFFIAAEKIDTNLLNAIGCRMPRHNLLENIFEPTFRNTHIQLVKDIANPMDSTYDYYYYPFLNSFTEINNDNIRVVGYNEAGDPNLILLFFGKGRLYLHCDPRAFSNYFILKNNNQDYLERILQLLPENVEGRYWNTYYNQNQRYKNYDGKPSLLSSLSKEAPLRWAFWLLLLLMLIFILFNGKRRQRVVPVIRPVQNSSVAFAEAIAGLYLKQDDNKVIAEKMVTYFNEYVRNHFFLNTANPNQDFMQSLSRKSGVAPEKVTELYQAFASIPSMSSVSDQQLLNLNTLIQEFYKHKK